jgi:hypothetical protein
MVGEGVARLWFQRVVMVKDVNVLSWKCVRLILLCEVREVWECKKVKEVMGRRSYAEVLGLSL